MPEEFKKMFDVMQEIREELGFEFLSTAEADPRVPGPPILALGITEDGKFMISVIDDDGMTGWEEITPAQIKERWPNSFLPMPEGAW